MQVHVESAEGTQRRMRVVVPAADLEGQLEERLRQTAKRVKLKGFRPGKVPLREVKRRFGAELRDEVSSQLVKSSFDQAMVQIKARPIGLPRIQEVKCEDGKDLEYTALFDVLPELKVGGLGSILIEKPSAKITAKDMDRMVATLREQRTRFDPVERGAQKGDLVTLDSEATLDGKVVETAGLADARLLLRGELSPKGFEEGLMGLKAGEEKAVPVVMPEDTKEEELAGKRMIFHVSMKTVAEPRLPELDDEFFRQFDITEGGLPAFREEVRRNMERELATAVRGQVKTQAIDGLIAQNPFDAPQSMIELEAQQLRSARLRQMLGATLEQVEELGPEVLPAARFLPQAERVVRASILIKRLVETNGIEPDDARVRALIETEASSYEDQEQVINYFYQHEAQLERVRNLALEEQVVDLILEQAKVKDKRCSYDEAVKPPAPPTAGADGAAAAPKGKGKGGQSKQAKQPKQATGKEAKA